MTDFEKHLAEELEKLRSDNSLRSLRLYGRRSGLQIEHNNRSMLNLSSNDYMGYASDEKLLSEFYSSLATGHLTSDFGLGSSASRLLSGNHPGYTKLENELEKLYGRPAIVYCSGYHANIGILPTLAERNDLILVDKLAHASILDGIRLSKAKCQRYAHNDMQQLRRILQEKRSDFQRVFAVTESIFSMDGDIADLRQLVELKKEFNLILYVDEAHAVGVRGESGLGIAEESDTINAIDIIIGTFGKALGGMGAFLITSSQIKEYLINKSRSFIFTTALPPVVINWNKTILKKMQSDNDRRKHLAALADSFRAELNNLKVATLGASHIVPAIIGDNQRTVELAEQMNRNDYLVLAIRPPTVPPNTARLRFSLSATMTGDELSGIFPILHKGTSA